MITLQTLNMDAALALMATPGININQANVSMKCSLVPCKSWGRGGRVIYDVYLLIPSPVMISYYPSLRTPLSSH